MGKNRETLAQVHKRLAEESQAAYAACPFSELSRDYFSRFSRDPVARPGKNEIEIGSGWCIVVQKGGHPLINLMATDLSEFLAKRMNVSVKVLTLSNDEIKKRKHCLALLDSGSGDPKEHGSFTLQVRAERTEVLGDDPAGLRDGVVRLVNLIGLRQAPFMHLGEQVCKPLLDVRLGEIPWQGSMRDLVFMGYNAVNVFGGSLYALSVSEAIPELKERQEPELFKKIQQQVAEASKYGLKCYSRLATQKFSKDDPIFAHYPEIRGSLTFKADGDYCLCTEHPLVRRYLGESVAGLFQEIPGLSGICVIVGGEGFYHCFTRPYGTRKGHTNCRRCEALGPEVVVANLCNGLADAARKANPDAEVVAWPYSAFLWSSDPAQIPFIRKLKPGTAILTEIEKDEHVEKSYGVQKHIWDYSIDLIGPGERAKKQIKVCRENEIPIYLKSEPELGFEAPRLPHVPCLDRWVARAKAMASCGATGAWVFPAFRPCYGASSAEIYQWMWWDPCRGEREILEKLSNRIAGNKAGPSLRRAWRLVSEAIPWVPELPAYYSGPHYLGPAHPMLANLEAKVPEVFYGQFLFHAEATDADGLKKHPIFLTMANIPTRERSFVKFFRKVEQLLSEAIKEIDKADAAIPARCRLQYRAEVSSVRWFYHTARAKANYQEAADLRNRLIRFMKFAEKNSRTPAEVEEAKKRYARWLAIMRDERKNAQQALPVAEGDMRLDCYYGGDHMFPHLTEMLCTKLKLLDQEINKYLPSVKVQIDKVGQ